MLIKCNEEVNLHNNSWCYNFNQKQRSKTPQSYKPCLQEVFSKEMRHVLWKVRIYRCATSLHGKINFAVNLCHFVQLNLRLFGKGKIRQAFRFELTSVHHLNAQFQRYGYGRILVKKTSFIGHSKAKQKILLLNFTT